MIEIDDVSVDELFPVESRMSPDRALAESSLAIRIDPDDNSDEPLDNSRSPLRPTDDTDVIDTLPETPILSEPPLVIVTEPPLPNDDKPSPADTITLPADFPDPANSEISPPTSPDGLEPTLKTIDPDVDSTELPVDNKILPLSPNNPSYVTRFTPDDPPTTLVFPDLPESSNTEPE